MEKPIITTAISLVLLTSASVAFSAGNGTAIQSQTVIATGQAGGGHESVEALKAEIAGLQTKLQSTETGRSYLLVRLREALDESKAGEAANGDLQTQNTDLLKSLRFMTDSRDYLLDELDTSNSMHKESAMNAASENEQQQNDLQRAVKGREFLSGQSKRNRGKLMAERKENARLSLALERALRGKSYLRGLVDEHESTSMAQQKDNARSSLALERALRGKSYLKGLVTEHESTVMAAEKDNARLSLALERALRGKGYLKGLVNEHESTAMSAEKDNARQSLALERALRGKSYLRGLVDEGNAENEMLALKLDSALKGREWYRSNAKELEKEVQQIADVSFSQINSAIAERDAATSMLNSTEWADTLSSDLSGSFANLNGTEVTSLGNNSVAIKVGNTGLFSLGGTVLSGAGKDLLGQIGSTLADRGDSNIKIVGHTDNIPTGSGSRFANNEELSLARATSALSYMTSIGVPAERLSVSGYGAAYPIDTNDTEEGQLANRRVEIVLTPLK